MGELIAQCQRQTKNTYGYRRVKLWLKRKHGLTINSKTVLRLMRKYGLLAQIRRPRPLYQRQQRMIRYENYLNRDFAADKPNRKWVTDISYIHTKSGVLYLSCIKDLYDNFIVAYDMGTAQDNALVYRTIIKKAEKEVADGLILHSDQGFQYTSHGYSNLLNIPLYPQCQERERLLTMLLPKTFLEYSKQNVSIGDVLIRLRMQKG